MGLLVPFYAGNFADKNLPGGDSAKVGLIASVVSFVVTWAVRCVAACLAGPALAWAGRFFGCESCCYFRRSGHLCAFELEVSLPLVARAKQHFSGESCGGQWARRPAYTSSADLRTFSCHCKLPRDIFRLCLAQEVFSLFSLFSL